MSERSTRSGLDERPGAAGGVSAEELQLATRNHGMPLEALRYEITPAGLHYVLVHYDIPAADAAGWRLEIGGRVARPLSLTLDELRARPQVTLAVTMECAGNGRARLEPRPVSQPWLVEAVGTAQWTGAALAPLLAEAGIAEDAVDVVFRGADRGIEGGVEQDYERGLPRSEALRDDVLLAWAMNGRPLQPQHGFPLRLIVPGWYGMTSVKWLRAITAVSEPFAGYQNAVAYRFRRDADDPGEPVTRMLPRSLLVPPGIPEFMSRRRFLAPGPVTLAGRAWSGWGEIAKVEVSTDGGRSWHEAELEAALSPRAWRRFTYAWSAAPGEHELCSRATDAAGNRQPLEAPWNVGGFANTSVQRVAVTVRDAA